MNLERFPSARARLPILVERIQEIFNQTLVPVMGKGHGVSTTTAAGRLAEGFPTSILEGERELTAGERGRSETAGDGQALDGRRDRRRWSP